MIFSVKRTFSSLTAAYAASALFLLAGCSGSSGVSSEVVSGVASVGATLAGQVEVKDASGAGKTAVIGNDGSYSVDVTGMKGPFIVQAKGSANGISYKLNSYAAGTGTAHVNPLSNVLVASAAGEDDPFEKPDPVKLGKIKHDLPDATETLLNKLEPLLKKYNAEHADPFGGHYVANHTGLDGLFDDVKITLVAGVITITNTKTGAIIFTGSIADLKNGHFTDDNNALPGAPAIPAAPAGLTATGGANKMSLAWSAVSNATSYNIYWSTQSGVTASNGSKLSSTANSYAQLGLSAGTTYYYVVSAVNSAGESAVSTQASATTDAAPVATVPLPPAGVTATGGSKQVSVAWSPVAGATSYNVYWSVSAGVTTGNGTKLAAATSPTVFNGLADGANYYYVVTAVNAVGESAASVQVAATTLAAVPAPTAPAAPSGLSATGGAKQETISWTPVSGAASYNLYWSTTPGVTTSTGTRIAAVSSPYVQTNLTAGTTYYYVVTAVNSVGESAASAQASAATNAAPPALPSAPTGVSATGGANQVSVSWAAVSGATSYNLYWSTSAGVTTASGTKIAGATSPYLQTGLAAGTSYFYVVTAVNSAGEGIASAQASAATNAPPLALPSAPAGVSATGGANQVSVSWAAVSGATSYNLYWSTSTGVTVASGTKIAGATSPFLQTGLAAGTSYFYVVTAVNSAGEGAASAQASATTNAPAPVFDALAFYNSSCLGCHGTLGPRTAAQITAAISSIGSMSRYRSTGSSPLTAAQISAIAAVSY
jgi:fibronectin type 3 domain-containing protein